MMSSVRQACCGHGHPEDAYFIFLDGTEVRGKEAVRLQQCWIHNNISPRNVVEIYLRVKDVEITYELCRMCSLGLVTGDALAAVLTHFDKKTLDFARIYGILEEYHKEHSPGDKQ
jgi:hypothetical protein